MASPSVSSSKCALSMDLSQSYSQRKKRRDNQQTTKYYQYEQDEQDEQDEQLQFDNDKDEHSF